MDVSRAHGLPVVNPVKPDGHFEDDLPLVGGVFFKEADPVLIGDLADRGLLFASHRHEHVTRIAGGAALCCSTTRCRRGLSGRPRSRTSCWRRTRRRPGIRLRSKRAGTASGCAITWTGRCRGSGLVYAAAAVGVRRPGMRPAPVAGRAVGADGAGPERAGAAPAVRRRGELPVPQCGERARRVPEVIDVWYHSGVDAVRPAWRAAAWAARF